MPLTGTRDLRALAPSAPLLPNLDTEPWELRQAEHLQLQYELGSESRTDLLPPALHPSIPPTLLINVTHVPESEVGAFTMSTVRIGCRSGARPRGLLVRGFCDSEAAIAALRDRWGFPLERAEVTLHSSYDHTATAVVLGGRSVLDARLVDPHRSAAATSSTSLPSTSLGSTGGMTSCCWSRPIPTGSSIARSEAVLSSRPSMRRPGPCPARAPRSRYRLR